MEYKDQYDRVMQDLRDYHDPLPRSDAPHFKIDSPTALFPLQVNNSLPSFDPAAINPWCLFPEYS